MSGRYANAPRHYGSDASGSEDEPLVQRKKGQGRRPNALDSDSDEEPSIPSGSDDKLNRFVLENARGVPVKRMFREADSEDEKPPKRASAKSRPSAKSNTALRGELKELTHGAHKKMVCSTDAAFADKRDSLYVALCEWCNAGVDKAARLQMILVEFFILDKKLPSFYEIRENQIPKQLAGYEVYCALRAAYNRPTGWKMLPLSKGSKNITNIHCSEGQRDAANAFHADMETDDEDYFSLDAPAAADGGLPLFPCCPPPNREPSPVDCAPNREPSPVDCAPNHEPCSPSGLWH